MKKAAILWALIGLILGGCVYWEEPVILLKDYEADIVKCRPDHVGKYVEQTNALWDEALAELQTIGDLETASDYDVWNFELIYKKLARLKVPSCFLDYHMNAMKIFRANWYAVYFLNQGQKNRAVETLGFAAEKSRESTRIFKDIVDRRPWSE